MYWWIVVYVVQELVERVEKTCAAVQGLITSVLMPAVWAICKASTRYTYKYKGERPVDWFRKGGG
jgi:hypothetical protein